ncbi:MAG: hypothetical protein R3E90_04175 [Marinicella sp.]
MKTFILTLITLFFSSWVQSVVAGGSRVTVGAVGDLDCDFTSIQAAVDSGSAEIRLGHTVFNENIDLSNRQSLSITGGYFNCADANNNSPAFFQTEISGIQALPVITINNDNSSHATVNLYSLYISNGQEIPGAPGAGLFISGNNTYVNADDIRIIGNQGSGVGISNNLSGGVNLKNTFILDNIAYDGGGIHCRNSNVQIYGSSDIYANEAIGSGTNAIDEGKGGGVYIGEGCSFNYFSGPPQIQSGLNGINWNQANHHGGGVYIENGGDIYLYGQPQNFTEVDSTGDYPVTLIGNSADADQNDSMTHGGAIYATGDHSVITMRGVTVKQNTAAGSGGGVALFNLAELSIARDPDQQCWSAEKCNFFSENQSQNGGAVYAEGGATVNIRNAWLEANSANFGSAVYLTGVDTAGLIDGAVLFNNDLMPGNETVKTVVTALFGAELSVLFSTIADHYVDTSVLALLQAQMDLYGTLIFQDGNLPVAAHVNGIFTAECMYLYDGTELNGPDVVVGANDPFINRSSGDLHLNANNLALDGCAPHPQSTSRDMDNEQRGWDDPIPDLSGLFDIGADESYLSDVIFQNNFE